MIHLLKHFSIFALIAFTGIRAIAQSPTSDIEFSVMTGLKIGAIHRGPNGEVLEQDESWVSFLLYFKNVSDHQIAIPTRGYDYDIEIRDRVAVVTFSIPDRRTPSGDVIAYSEAELALVHLFPGEVAAYASRVNARFLSHVAVSDFACEVTLDAARAERYGYLAGRFSQPIQPFGPIVKTGEPGATDNPEDAQRLREDH